MDSGTSHDSIQQEVQRRMVLVVIFLYFETELFCFVVDICDPVHDVDALFYLP